MSTITTSVSSRFLKIPYTCRCMYCGSELHLTDEITTDAAVSVGGYADKGKKMLMNMSSSFNAAANFNYELEYNERQLEHFRKTVSDGSLLRYLQTAKRRRNDLCFIDKNSALGYYLKSTVHKTKAQYQKDMARLNKGGYAWRNNEIKCPCCGKIQPWSADLDLGYVGLFAILTGFAVTIILGVILFKIQVYGLARLMIFLADLAVGVGTGFAVKCIGGKIYLKKYAALNWRVQDMPAYDRTFLNGLHEKLQLGDWLWIPDIRKSQGGSL